MAVSQANAGVMERYGVSSQRVFRHTQPVSGSPWVGQLGRGGVAALTLPPLSRRSWGSHSNCHSNMEFETSSVGASSLQQQGATAFSVEELRNIVLAPGKSKVSLEKPRSRPTQLTCSSPQLGRCSHPSAASHDPKSANIESLKCRDMGDMGTAAARRAKTRAFSKQIAAKHKSESPSHHRPHAKREDRDGAGSCNTVDYDDDIVDDDEDKDLTWSGGVSSVMASLLQPGKVRKKKGKGNMHENPFVEYEDREQRLQWERRWLKDDEVYMDERMKGIRLNSVQARMQRKEMPRNVLYQDAVYFGAYSKELKQLLKKKADVRRSQDLAVPGFEAEHAVVPKSKKSHGDISEGISSIKSMKAALQESAAQTKGEEEDSPTVYLSEGAIERFKSFYKGSTHFP